MEILRRIAEAKIQEAIARGEFDNLPGNGRPLQLDDDLGVSPDMRLAYKVLRNADVLPPEMELRQQIYKLNNLIAGTDDEAELAELRRRVRDSELRYSMLMERRARR